MALKSAGITIFPCTLVPRRESDTASPTRRCTETAFLMGCPPLAKVSSWWASSAARCDAFFCRRERQSRLVSLFEQHMCEGHVPHDAGQYVVEIVCDPSGENAQRFHLLHLQKLVVDEFLFGDVGEDLQGATLENWVFTMMWRSLPSLQATMVSCGGTGVPFKRASAIKASRAPASTSRCPGSG